MGFIVTILRLFIPEIAAAIAKRVFAWLGEKMKKKNGGQPPNS